MKKQSLVSVHVISRVLALTAVVAVTACASSTVDQTSSGAPATPTVDYVERLDVYSAPHRDSFLNQLAMNYRSYAIYNARTSGFPDIGELFAQKAVNAFSGEVPFPESLSNWEIADEQTAYELTMAYNDMIDLLKNDASQTNPELAAELQAKYDCWLSATASGQNKTARECKSRFEKTLTALRDCRGGRIVNSNGTQSMVSTQRMMSVGNGGAVYASSVNGVPVVAGGAVSMNSPAGAVAVRSGTGPVVTRNASGTSYYPETNKMAAMRGANRTREGVIIVNNVNVPENLINPEPVQPMVFNQNIYGGDKTLTDNSNSNNSSSVADSGNTAVRSDCPCAKQKAVPVAEDYYANAMPCGAQVVDGTQTGQVYPCQGNTNVAPQNQQMYPEQNLMNYAPQNQQMYPLQYSAPVLTQIQMQPEQQQQVPQKVIQENYQPVSVTVNNPTPVPLAQQEPCPCADEEEEINIIAEGFVSRKEFIDMMMAMRAELAAINERLDKLAAKKPEKVRMREAAEETTIIKVQQIPLEPTQHVMEEVLEIRFDFDKATIKPEYDDVIKKLVGATQANKNIKVSVVGHTDTSGSKSYNYALGGRRAEAVQKMLIGYGIPSSQIVAVSAGEEDLKVQTGDGVPNAENRRVRIVKEETYTEPGGQMVPVANVDIEEFVEDCGGAECDK